MLRNILGVIVGYIVMFVIVVALLFGLYAILGQDGSFKPGTFEPSMLWLVLMFMVGLVASIVGGMVCAWMSKGSSGARLGLVVLVMVLGLLMAVGQLMQPEPTAAELARGTDMSNIEAMNNARTPLWVAFSQPFLGAAGVLIGSGLVGSRSKIRA
ncbi:MAG: hypothetical protein ACF8MF_03345 [Phycisphaerales bacterium JB052]